MKHTTTPRLLQHGWQRMLAVILASAILVTGISFSGIIEAFAKQSSGYEIYAEYIEDNAKAVLKGKGENVPEGVTVAGLKDADGNELDPKALEYTVDMNGTYKFTVEYEIMQEVEGGSVIKEETEELSVTVDQIRLPEVLTEAPEVMAVSELKARMANAPAPAAAATKEFIMLSAESEYELGRYNYAGGNVNDDSPGQDE